RQTAVDSQSGAGLIRAAASSSASSRPSSVFSSLQARMPIQVETTTRVMSGPGDRVRTHVTESRPGAMSAAGLRLEGPSRRIALVGLVIVLLLGIAIGVTL